MADSTPRGPFSVEALADAILARIIEPLAERLAEPAAERVALRPLAGGIVDQSTSPLGPRRTDDSLTSLEVARG
ncbi:unnamed protein product [marine sediment metagenome]|uniref:Uncharacterized protein n=1 Tax=marine sediment metagenome TaxID=412755 RepID=X0XR59_9ZZZZ